MTSEEQYEGFVDISTDKDQGILKKIIKDGCDDATPTNGSRVFVHYTGTFHGGDKDGEKFDSSRDRGEKFSFILGDGQVIKAWEVGVSTMKKNEICEMICKPEYAYGDKETGSIPANSTLKFEIELYDWKGKDISPNKDESIIHTILNPGTGYDSPKSCFPVKISIRGIYNDKVFDERDHIEFEIGDGISHNLIPGIEIALKKMKKGEKSKFDIEAQFAFGKDGNIEWGIPGDANVTYEIYLKEFEKLKESYSLDTTEDKLQYAEKFKISATDRFQKGNFTYASKLYEKAVSYIEYDNDFSTDEKVQRNNLMLALKLNIALCCLKNDDYNGAIDECDKALEIDPKNEKALYRKGQGLMLKSNFDEAKEMFEKLLTENPSNKEAINQIKNCDAKIKEYLNMEKKLYQSMFSKMGKITSGDATKITDSQTMQGKVTEEIQG